MIVFFRYSAISLILSLVDAFILAHMGIDCLKNIMERRCLGNGFSSINKL